MAEATALRNNATDYPVYGLPWTVLFPILDADGDGVTGATGLDSEVSLNCDTPADCTNEATEIGSSCQYYLSFTATEMTADIVSWVTKTSSSGAKATFGDLYPKKLPVLLTSDNAGAYDSTTTINLGSGAVAIDDYYIGCLVYIYGGTGNGQVRMITDYVGATKLATVHVAWATNPDATSDLKIYRTEQAPYCSNANVMSVNGTAQTAKDLGASVTQTGDSYAVVSNATYGNSALSARIPAELESGNIPAVVKAQDNIDFGALQKASLNAATPSVTVSDKTGFSLAATGADLILKSSTFIQAIVAAINELATYGLTALNTLLVTTGIKTASTAAPTDMALNSTVAKETTLAAVAGYLDTEIADILADTNEMQGDLKNGGRLDLLIDAIKAKTDTIIAGGAGAITWTYTVTDSVPGNPIDGVEVWVTTDSAGTNIIASGTSSSLGVVTFYLDAGTYYIWCKKAGYNFTNPDTEVVS